MSDKTKKLEDQNLEDSESEEEDDTELDEDNDETLGKPGKKALATERKARRAAEAKASDLEKEVAKISKKLQDIEDKEAEEQGEWEKLASDRATRIEELEQDIAQRDLNDKKASAVSKFKFTEDELALLHGETLEEYETNAKALAKLLKKNSGPDVSGGSTSTNTTGGSDESTSKLKTWKFK